MPGAIPIFQRKNISVGEVNHWRWLEESGHRLENIDQTPLVLASGNRVLKKLWRSVIFYPG